MVFKLDGNSSNNDILKYIETCKIVRKKYMRADCTQSQSVSCSGLWFVRNKKASFGITMALLFTITVGF